MDITILIKIYADGIMTTFYVLMITQFMMACIKREGDNAHSLFKLSATAGGWLLAQSIMTVVLDTMTVMEQHGQACQKTIDALLPIQDMMAMMTIPVFGTILYALSRVRRCRWYTVVFWQLPIIAAAGAFVATGNYNILRYVEAYVLAYSVMIVVLTHLFVRRYQHMLNKVYSNTQRRGITWLLVFLYALVLQLVLWYMMDRAGSGNEKELLYYAISIVLWTFYSRRVFRQNYDIKDIASMLEDSSEEQTLLEEIAMGQEIDELSEEEKAKERSKSATDETMQQLGEKIHHYCVVKRNFQNPELSIGDLTMAVGSNRTYTARWFSQQGKNFNTYINDLRLEYAVELLTKTDSKLITVYTKAGFSTAHNFRRLFKQKYGCTPSEYKQELAKASSDHE